MTDLERLYNQIQNPIEDIEIIKILIDGYINNYPIYILLTNYLYKENKNKNSEQENQFHALLFNTWKSSITNMNNQRFEYLKKQGKLEEDFLKLKSYLLTIPDVSSLKDVDNFWYGTKSDKQIHEIMSKYWFMYDDDWSHIFASRLFIADELNFDVEHRLYLNPDLFNIHEIMKYYLEKCIKYNLSFYFKFRENAVNDDCIVIYSNTENLVKNVEILREIEREYPELISKMYYPPILTGIIDEWIGYGSEPQSYKINRSYNRSRENLIYPSIKKATIKWYEYRHSPITMTGYELDNYIRSIAKEALENDPDFIILVQEELKKASRENNIDENNFSIDCSAKIKMLNKK